MGNAKFLVVLAGAPCVRAFGVVPSVDPGGGQIGVETAGGDFGGSAVNTGYQTPPGMYIATCGQKYIQQGSKKNSCAPGPGKPEGYSDITSLGECASAQAWFQDFYQETKGKDYWPMGDTPSISQTDRPANCFFQNVNKDDKTIVFNAGAGGNSGTYDGIKSFKQLCKFTAACGGPQTDDPTDGAGVCYKQGTGAANCDEAQYQTKATCPPECTWLTGSSGTLQG
jgi:hypothetical protein